MAVNRGKQFEQHFREDFLKLPDVSLDRIYDSVSGYKSVSNICDFIGFHEPNIFYLELKSTNSNTFPLVNLTQYGKLQFKIGIKGVRVGVIIWFIIHDRIIYVPCKTIQQMKLDNIKSVNITKLANQSYRFIEIPVVKKKVFLDANYSVLFNLEEGD